MNILPEDVLPEILVRLPVKSLLRFRCVSKSWCALIKSPHFIDLHLNRAKNSEDVCFLVKRFIKDERKTALSFHSIDESLSLRVVAPDFEVPYIVDHSMWLISTCNGIVCLMNDQSGDIYLCNPGTRELRTLPERPFGCPQEFRCWTNFLGFGFDPTTNDYKIVNIVEFVHGEDYALRSNKAEIYCLSTNCWREIDATLRPLVYFPCYSVLFNGCFHWCTAEFFDFTILSFDMSTELFREILYPEAFDPEIDWGPQKLIVVDNSLALIIYTGLEQASEQFVNIWVMMEYGVPESWIKKFSIGPFSGIQYPISSWNNDKLLVEMSNGQLASCSLLDNVGGLKKYNVYGFPTSLRAVIYQESLISISERSDRQMKWSNE